MIAIEFFEKALSSEVTMLVAYTMKGFHTWLSAKVKTAKRPHPYLEDARKFSQRCRLGSAKPSTLPALAMSMYDETALFKLPNGSLFPSVTFRGSD